MKIISILLTLCFSLNLFASTGAVQELESSLDEYQFAMTVEWDQKDEAFKNAQIDQLSAKVASLFKSGLSVQDVNFLVSKRFQNSKAAEAVKLKLALLGDQVTPANVAQVLKENSFGLYQQGASWNGETQMFISIGVAIVAIIAISVAYSKWKDANYECVEYAQADYCTDAYDCWSHSDSSTSSGSCYYVGTRCGSYERCIKEVRIGL